MNITVFGDTMNKPVYLGLSILEISDLVIYEFWYNYVKTKYGEKKGIMLHGYRQLYSLYKNKRHLHRHFKRC